MVRMWCRGARFGADVVFGALRTAPNTAMDAPERSERLRTPRWTLQIAPNASERRDGRSGALRTAQSAAMDAPERSEQLRTPRWTLRSAQNG